MSYFSQPLACFMYTPPSFQIRDRTTLFALMEEFSFATLISGHEGSLTATHLPLLVKDEDGGKILGHVARANDQWRMFDGETEALAIFQGPHAYVSPSWYATHPSVPTWNYVVVHAYGMPAIIDDFDAVVALLRETVKKYEAGFAKPWPMDLPEDYLAKMVKAIVAFEIPVTRIEGKAKLSQNRSGEDIERVIEALDRSAAADERSLAKMMRDDQFKPK